MSYLTKAIRWTKHWHARIGFFASVFFLCLVFSGVALNHTKSIGLAERTVKTPWLMDWMGLRADLPADGYKVGEQYVISSSEKAVLNSLILHHVRNEVLGAVSWNGLVAVVDKNTLYLFDNSANLIDHIGGENLPKPTLQGIGLLDEKIVLKTEAGAYQTDDALHWKKLNSKNIVWSEKTVLPEMLKPSIETNFSPSISMEKLLLDLHSGRIFGRYGPLLMDLVAFILFLPSISGVWMYLRVMRHSHKK